MAAKQPFWKPSEEEIEKAGITKFRKYVNERYDLELRDFWDLWRWSTGTPEEMNSFWDSIWDWTGMIGEKGQTPLFDARQPISRTKSFMTGARLNWAENLLLGHPLARSKSAIAIHACIESDRGQSKSPPLHIRSLTFENLYIEVAQAVNGLKKLGIRQGDTIGAITSNNAEAIVMCIASSAIGAVWSSVAPEFGIKPILDRFEQLKPKVLLTVDAYRSAGRTLVISSKLQEVVQALRQKGLRAVVVVGQLHEDRRPRGDLPKSPGVLSFTYEGFLDKTAKEIVFQRMPANCPLWVLYSSGTTGKPKAIIHNQLGMVWAMKAYGPLHQSISPGDCQLQITTTGWMMWNQMVNHLFCGVTLVCYDGSPLYPDYDALFQLVDRYQVTSFSLSPRYLQILVSKGIIPKDKHDLRSLKSIFVTGAPTKPALYDYIRDCIKPVWINNGSGGTDVCTGLMGGVPVLPIQAGVIQGPFLGCAIAVYDEEGRKVEHGEGDLVIEKPFPMMPLGFLGDTPDSSKFKDAYYNHYKDKEIWYHSDHVLLDTNGGYSMLGRSDGVLNPQGVRFGSSEIYSVIEQMKDQIEDCIAVGQKLPDGDERVVLFVKHTGGKQLSKDLVSNIQNSIARQLSRRHVPAKIIGCEDIPYTLNGKKVEVAVKKLINGSPLSSLNTTGIMNPTCLTFFVNHPELVLEQKAKL